MNRIYTQWGEKKPTIASNPGTREKQDYIMDIDPETRDKILKPNGFTNTWEMIQAERDQADINKIIEKATRGDYSGLKDQAAAVYGDFSKPMDMQEMMRLKLRADKLWSSLPLNIRKEYDNDPDKYVMDFGSENWLKLHGIEVKKEEVKEEAKVDE